MRKENNIETKRIIHNLEDYFREPIEMEINDLMLTTKIDMNATMLNGKAMNTVVGNNASSKCPLCLKTRKDFKNDMPFIDHPVENAVENNNYSISLLHCRIRTI